MPTEQTGMKSSEQPVPANPTSEDPNTASEAVRWYSDAAGTGGVHGGSNRLLDETVRPLSRLVKRRWVSTSMHIREQARTRAERYSAQR